VNIQKLAKCKHFKGWLQQLFFLTKTIICKEFTIWDEIVPQLFDLWRKLDRQVSNIRLVEEVEK